MERWLRSRMAAQDAAGHKTRIALRNASSNAPGRYPGSRVPGTLLSENTRQLAAPSQVNLTQWLLCRLLLVDRCGGSAGLVSTLKVSTHRLPV